MLLSESLLVGGLTNADCTDNTCGCRNNNDCIGNCHCEDNNHCYYNTSCDDNSESCSYNTVC